MTREPIKFMESFEPKNLADWRALAEKSLKGKPLDKLTTKTLDGLEIRPLYTAADRAGAPPPRPVPGEAVAAWDICQPVFHAEPAAANADLLDDLGRGASGGVLVMDRATRHCDASDPGADGIGAAGIADFVTLLKGTEPDIHGLHFLAGASALPVAAMVLAVAQEAELPASALEARLHIDPLGALAAAGRLPCSLEAAFAGLVAGAKAAAGADNHLRAVGVDTSAYHNAGGSEVQELSYALATGVEYLRKLTQAGLGAADAGKITFTFAVDADFFLSIAKLRAFRMVWAQVLEAVFPGAEAAPYEILAVTSGRMMSRRDVNVNMLRATSAAFAAAVGGADAIAVLPFSVRHGLPTEHARRIARNTQIILEAESNITRIADPAAGSYALDTLTDDLAKAAWSAFQAIEAEGGMAKALAAGAIQKAVAEKAAARRKAIATRKIALTGVNEFPDLTEAPVATRHGNRERVAANIAETAAAAEAEHAVRDALKAIDPAKPDTLLPALVAAARAGATLAQMSQRLQGEPATAPPLQPHHLDEDFETLRFRSDEVLARSGARPQIFLASIGKPADFSARANFAKAFFEAGGIAAIETDGFASPQDAAAAFAETGAPFAVLCSSDDLYSEHGAPFAREVKQAGARALYFAGPPGELEKILSAAGVDEFVYVGCDVAAVLKRAYDMIGGGK